MPGNPPSRAPVLAVLAMIGMLLSACGQPGRAEGPVIRTVAFPGAAGSAEPRLTLDTDDGPVLSWLEREGEATVLFYARYADGAFSAPQEVLRSNRMFENWADFPSVTPISSDFWFAHWLRLQPDSFGAYDIATAVSHDGGLHWTEAEQMNEDETRAEHGFVRVFASDGAVAAFWLDGRELAQWSIDEPDALLATSLRLARYDASGRVRDRQIVDPMVCDCCAPDVAITSEGPIVIYRDRTEEEIRDVVIRRFEDGAWSGPLGLGDEGWRIEACPVNGPVIDAAAGLVVAAWFTAADNQPRLRLARSSDAGRSFTEPLDIDVTGVLGQPAVTIDASGQALVSWWRRGVQGGIDLAFRTVAGDGSAGPIRVLAHESIGQVVDVPQMVRAGDEYLFAWTSLDGNGGVRTARLDFSP